MIRRATAVDLPGIVAMQQAAYASGRKTTGVEALPLRADYDSIFAQHECWILGDGEALEGVLILELRPDDLLIWSIATHPRMRSKGLGSRLFDFAVQRTRDTRRTVMRLYTNERLTRNIAWYTRRGFTIERIEEMADRCAVHMKKILEDES